MTQKNFLNICETYRFLIIIFNMSETFGVSFYYDMAFMVLTVVLMPIYLLYFLGHYAHPDDSKFGGSFFARSMIFLGFMISYISLLSV